MDCFHFLLFRDSCHAFIHRACGLDGEISVLDTFISNEDEIC